jgi:hypothetical protein
LCGPFHADTAPHGTLERRRRRRNPRLISVANVLGADISAHQLNSTLLTVSMMWRVPVVVEALLWRRRRCWCGAAAAKTSMTPFKKKKKKVFFSLFLKKRVKLVP